MPFHADETALPQPFAENLTLGEFKQMLLQSMVEAAVLTTPVAAEDGLDPGRVRLRYVGGSSLGDKRHPLQPTGLLKGGDNTTLGTLRELRKSGALAVTLLPDAEPALRPQDKMFTLWRLVQPESGVGVPQFAAAEDLVVRPEDGALTLEKLLAALEARTGIPADRIRLAKRQTTSLAEWGPWQAVGEPLPPPAGAGAMADATTDVLDTPLPGAVQRKAEKGVNKLVDFTLLGVADASMFALLEAVRS